MAGGVLAMISLYTLGYRENRQSREDVAAAACADDVLNRLVLALSSTNITWKSWKNLPYVELGKKTDDGKGKNGAVTWRKYLKINNNGSWWVKEDPQNTASTMFQNVTDPIADDVKKDKEMPWDKILKCPTKSDLGTGTGQMTFALVAFRDSKDSPVMSISMRVVRQGRWRSLMSQPIFFAEVHFQGNMNGEDN